MPRRSLRTSPLISLSNSELSRQERANRRNRATRANMAANDGTNRANMTAEFQALQQEMADMRRELNRRQPPLVHHPPPAPPPQPPIGAADRPHTFYTNRSAIVYPAIDRNEYEIKPQLLALIDKTPFNGFPNENPMDHIERIERVASFFRSNGIPPDFTLCKLFEFSLANRAIAWLNSLPAGSLVGWAAVRDAFLDHYFTKSKTATLRAKISTFQQHSGESFCEAWERFKSYKRDCPHHGFDDTQLVSIFYEGVNWDYKNQLNSASNGNFMTRGVDDATQLIENLAESSADRSMEYDRKKGANAVDTERMAELTTQLSEVKDLLRSHHQREVHLVEPEDNGTFEQEEVNYVTGQGSNQGFNPNFQHPNLSYRNPNVANPQDQHYPPAVNPNPGTNPTQRPYQGQGSSSRGQGQQSYNKPQYNYQAPPPYQPPPMRNYNNPRPPQFNPPPSQKDTSQDEIKGMLQLLIANSQKSDGRVEDLATKLDALTTHVRTMDTQLAQQAETIQRQPGTLPGRPDGNPRHANVSAITLRSGRELVSQEKVPSKPLQTTELEENTRSFSSTSCFDGDVLEGGQADIIDDQEEAEKEPEEAKLSTHASAKPSSSTVERVYVPKAPYPTRSRSTKKTLEESKCKEILDEIEVKCKLRTAIALWPAMKSTMKNMISSKITDEEAPVMVTEECSSILLSKMPKKLGDPGRFVLSVDIGAMNFPRSLCDLGSSINLMPLSVARQLGFMNYKPTRIALIFADRSTRQPVGVLEDVIVKVGNALVPADFVVLEVEDVSKDPLILGRPFLCTAGAIIDVKNGLIDLHLGHMVMQFQMDRLLKKPMLDGQTFSIEDPLESCFAITDEILVEDPLELALTREQGPYGFSNDEACQLTDLLDSSPSLDTHSLSLSLEATIQHTPPPTTSHGEPWCKSTAPQVDFKPLPAGLRYAFLGIDSTYPVIINASLSNAESNLLLHHLRKYRKALGYSLDDIRGISPDLCMHRIRLEDESTSSIEHQRRLNPVLKEVVKKEVLKLLEAGIIYAISDSRWISPVHVVPKKGGITVVANDKNELIPTRTITGHRMCVDYRKLNLATCKDHFPLPFIDQMLERLSNHAYYCFLDGYSGFFQIPIHPDDQEKTTFTCPYGTFAYRRMPFGLCNAPATFQRAMMSIFSDMIEEIVEVFMDDFSVYGSSFSSCLSNLCRVLKRCEEKNLVLNWEKCHFMVKDGIVLGHRISENGIEVDKAKVEVMTSLPPPNSVKGVRSFLGHAGFYRRFIKDFSKMARPLTQLLCKEVKFEFDEECLQAFNQIKEALVSAPIVQPPDWNLPFEVMTDATRPSSSPLTPLLFLP